MNGELGPFIKLFYRHWKWMALGTLFGLLTITASVGLLSLAGWFISATAAAGLTVATAYLFNFFYPSIGVRLFAIVRTAGRYAERIVCHDTTFRILESLRSWFYRHLEPLAPSCLMQYRSADILNRIVADIDALDNLYVRVLSPSVVALLLGIIVLSFLWIFDPVIAGTAFLFLFAAGFAVPVVAAKVSEQTARQLPLRTADLRVRIVEGLQGLPELLVFGGHHRHLNNVEESNRALLQSQLQMSQIRGFSTALITLLSGFAVLTVLYLGVDLVNRDVLDGANLALLGLAVLASFEAVLPLPLAFQYLGQTREAGHRLLEIVNSEPAVSFPEKSNPEPVQFDLKFDQVSFRYFDDGPLAVSEVDFHVSHGQRVAVIGETGAGKSTLVNLLVRFWNPTSGRILLGGNDIRTLSESDLRGYVAVVSQQLHMFNSSLRENLQIARPGASEGDLRQALDSAQLIDFVDSLPDGLDTWIGEAGKLLSAGQARRLAVARAILRDAPIWVLDEPTEGLDRITEQQMMKVLHGLTADRTVLLITHRLVDLHSMDRIVMLERGRIIEQGNHEALLKGNTRYAALQASIL
ncbi:MAG: cysteine/glutathione ABC transporter ATP-binding protein/permease CydC [Deltaproteobacteria bacterium]|nr:MAG: cysteine/glutathione ABC transporter ATP-binding protein/permease CydC [Deltaproteobacteria bacterium]